MSADERIARNIEKLRRANAPFEQVDCYVASEGIQIATGGYGQRSWRKPIDAGASELSPAAIVAQYGLE